jgi:hypothetical protein
MEISSAKWVFEYANDSFDYWFDKFLFIIIFLNKPKNGPKSPHIKNGYQRPVINC